MKTITRHEFLRLTVTFVGAGVALGCSSSSSSSGGTNDAGNGNDAGGGDSASNADTGSSGSCASNGAKNGTISANHGHSLTIAAADFATAAEHTYDIQGTASHTHQITLSVANFQTLLGGGTVTVTSTTNVGHSHAVQVECA